MGTDDQDGFGALRRSLPAMPAVVPENDADLDDDNEHPPQEPAAPATDEALDEARASLRVQVVDDASDRPLPGVVLRVTRPDGVEVEVVSDARGLVDLDDLDAGCAAILSSSFEGRTRARTWIPVALEAGDPSDLPPLEFEGPLCLADVEVHKVATGESIAGLAKTVELSWQRLADFNWGTSIPARINEHLRDDVGCTRFAADGINYVFDDGDDPGLVHLPRPWRLADVPLDSPQRLRVSREPPARRLTIAFLLSGADQLDSEFPRYVLRSADGEYDEQRSARDDLVPGDHYLQLAFEGLRPDTTYTLTRWHDAETREVLFADAPCASIIDQSRAGARGLAGGAFTGLTGMESLGTLDVAAHDALDDGSAA